VEGTVDNYCKQLNFNDKPEPETPEEAGFDDDED
jgi:hypothetical protein